MNKIQVGAAPSPNLKTVRSKIGSLQNAAYKPGGGRVKIESRKLEWKAAPKIEALNDTYVPRGGDKKVRSSGPAVRVDTYRVCAYTRQSIGYPGRAIGKPIDCRVCAFTPGTL